MADKLLIPIEVAGKVELAHCVGAFTKVDFWAPSVVACSLAEKIKRSYTVDFWRHADPGDDTEVEGSTYYVPPPSRFMPEGATPEQQVEAMRLFEECCDTVARLHRRAITGKQAGIPHAAVMPILMQHFRYYWYSFEFNSQYEDRSVFDILDSLSGTTFFNLDEEFYVKAIITAIEAGTK